MSLIKFLVKKVEFLFAQCLSLLPLPYIVFESLPDFADNTKAVFDEMIHRGINKRYKFVWLCNKKSSVLPIRGVISESNKIKQIYYTMRAKCAISCNTFVHSFGEYQKSFYLCHGIPLKSLGGYKAYGRIDYVAGLSERTNEIQSKELSIEIAKFYSLGYPRNDALIKKNHDDINKLFNGNFKKIIAWYPTFRQHNVSHIQSASKNALPIIHNAENAVRINELAKTENVLIVLKPHFSQDTHYVEELQLSNIVFINDDFFKKKNITSYEFIGGCDALITDYSSIYFDFLLCEKPIAAIWEDIEEYRQNRGFAVDVDYYMKGAFKIYNLDDFQCFVKQVVLGVDCMKANRDEIINLIHKYKDFNSTERVVDFIEHHLL